VIWNTRRDVSECNAISPYDWIPTDSDCLAAVWIGQGGTMKTYFLQWVRGVLWVMIRDDEMQYPGTPPMRFLDEIYHFGEGRLTMGDLSSETSDLALSILCDHFGERPKPYELVTRSTEAQKYLHHFKMRFLVSEGDVREITSLEIEQLVADVNDE
jgi:hypothetical protein